MSQEDNRMQSSDEQENEVLKEYGENEEPKFPRRRLEKKSISVPELVAEDEEDLDDNIMEPTVDSNDKVGKKRQRKRDESGLEKPKKIKTKKQDNSAEIKEMWDSITNNKSSKDGDKKVGVNRRKKTEDDYEIEKNVQAEKKKSKDEKNKAEIALQVEQVMANLEIAVEDDVELNKEGKPAINKLMNLPLLSEALSKIPLQADFLDHGVLNLLKNWLEPLPDGSLPNINIRTTILKILNDLCISLDQDCRRQQLIKSGLGKVIMFLSKSNEETTLNRKLANDLVNKWGHIIYNKSTRYENMFTREELEEQQEMLLRREIKNAPKVSKPIARYFDVDIDFSQKPKSKLAASTGVERARIPEAISMDFVLRPNSKFDKELKARAKIQIDNKIKKKLQLKKALSRKSMQAFKPSADGRTMFKYL